MLTPALLVPVAYSRFGYPNPWCGLGCGGLFEVMDVTGNTTPGCGELDSRGNTSLHLEELGFSGTTGLDLGRHLEAGLSLSHGSLIKC